MPERADGLPTEFNLGANFPNPFNPATTIPFAVPVTGHVTLDVVDELGRSVATLVSEALQPGTYRARWDARGVASGVYYYRLRGPGFTRTRALVLVK